MALTCPNCHKINGCDCKSCNPDGDVVDLVIILRDEELYQCCFCGHKFNEQDSLDYEWDKMLEDFAKRATPELCLEWISIIGKERKKLEDKVGIGEFGFEQAFRIHFKMSYNNVSRETYKALKRDLIIKNLTGDLGQFLS